MKLVTSGFWFWNNRLEGLLALLFRFVFLPRICFLPSHSVFVFWNDFPCWYFYNREAQAKIDQIQRFLFFSKTISFCQETLEAVCKGCITMHYCMHCKVMMDIGDSQVNDIGHLTFKRIEGKCRRCHSWMYPPGASNDNICSHAQPSSSLSPWRTRAPPLTQREKMIF